MKYYNFNFYVTDFNKSANALYCPALSELEILTSGYDPNFTLYTCYLVFEFIYFLCLLCNEYFFFFLYLLIFVLCRFDVQENSLRILLVSDNTMVCKPYSAFSSRALGKCNYCYCNGNGVPYCTVMECDGPNDAGEIS